MKNPLFLVRILALWLALSSLGLYQIAHGQVATITRENVHVTAEAAVNTYSGNLFFQLPLSLFVSPFTPTGSLGGDELAWLSYNSDLINESRGFGPGWQISLEQFYQPDTAGDITFNRRDGRQDKFEKSGGTFMTPKASQDTLIQSSDSVVIRDKYGNVRTFGDSTHKKVTQIQDRCGNTLNYTHTNGELTLFTDAQGRSVTINWSGNKVRTIIEANTGTKRVWYFRYSGDKLVGISMPGGAGWEFRYDDQGLMTQYVNPNGHALNVNYYENNAVQEVTMPAVGIQQFYSYNFATLSVTLTEMVGLSTQNTTYEYDALGRLTRRVGSCCGFETSYEYDAEDNITKITDANGNETHFTYDSKGNMLTKTDALGNTITYTYGTAFNLLTSATDRMGNTITYTYDSKGNMIQVDLPLGVTMTYTYDGKGQLISVTDGMGETTTFTYDAVGNLATTTLPNSAVLTKSYDAIGNLISETDGDGLTVTATYDPANRLTSTTGPGPSFAGVAYGYDAMGNLINFIDAEGNITAHSYDALKRRTSTQRADGATETYVFDQKNQISFTDPLGNTTTYAYDGRNLVTLETDPIGTKSFTYDAYGNLTSYTDRNGNVTTYIYNAMNLLIKEATPLGDTLYYGYDTEGHYITQIDGRGNTREMLYDELGRKVGLIPPLGDTTRNVYDKAGRLIEVIDGRGNIVKYGYDKVGNQIYEVNELGDTIKNATYNNRGGWVSDKNAHGLITTARNEHNAIISQTNALAEITTFTHTLNGNIATITYPNGNTVTSTYDPLGRLTSTTDLLGTLSEQSYDDLGRIVEKIVGGIDTTEFTYDALSRKTAETDNNGNSITYTYDGNGNILTETDRNGNVTQHFYDAQDRPIRTVDANGDTTHRTYDANGNMTSIKDEKGNVTTFTWDANDQRTRADFPDGSFEAYGYNEMGDMTYARDRAGDTTFFTVDAAGNVIAKNRPGVHEDKYFYDEYGRIDSVWNQYTALGFGYDQIGRLATQTTDGETLTLNQNSVAQTRTMTYPSGRIVLEEWDDRDRIAAIKEGPTTIAAYTYDAIGRVSTQANANGTSSTYMYDAVGNLSRMTHSRSSAFYDVLHSYSNGGYRQTSERLHRSTHSHAYTYDNINRLTGNDVGTLVGSTVPAPISQETVSYDEVGNRTSFTDATGTSNYVANAANQYTSVTGTGAFTPTYDANGNLTYDGTLYYHYDYDQVLTRVSTDAAGTNLVATYRYDPLGRRAMKIVGTDTTRYYHHINRLIEERTSSDTLTYVYGNGLDGLVTMTRNDSSWFYHLDVLGSVAVMTDQIGRIAERYTYSSYGQVSIFDSLYVARAATAIGNVYAFTGRRLDSESGLYFYRKRYYHAGLGRFMQNDPLEYIDGMNMYEYVKSSPTHWTDPLGLAVVNLRMSCNGPWPGPKTLNIRFENCEPRSKYVGIGNRMCHSFRAAGQAWVDVYRYRQYVDNGVGNTVTPSITRGARLFGQFFAPAGSSRAGGTAKARRTTVVNNFWKIFKAFDKPIRIRCVCDCGTVVGSSTANAAAWRNNPGNGIILCCNFFTRNNARQQSAIILHEISHAYAGTHDHGYTSNTNIPATASPTYRMRNSSGTWVNVNLSRNQLAENADTYETYFLHTYLRN